MENRRDLKVPTLQSSAAEQRRERIWELILVMMGNPNLTVEPGQEGELVDFAARVEASFAKETEEA